MLLHCQNIPPMHITKQAKKFYNESTVNDATIFEKRNEKP